MRRVFEVKPTTALQFAEVLSKIILVHPWAAQYPVVLTTPSWPGAPVSRVELDMADEKIYLRSKEEA